MKLPPFLLDHWLAAHEFSSPPIRFNLASSTGPAWTLGQLLALGGEAAWMLDGRDSRPTCQALAREGVLVAPGDCFGLPEHFRMGIGAQTTGFQDALEVASRVFAKA
jgi:hypothetical protein